MAISSKAEFFDGHTASSRKVMVCLTGENLQLRGDDSNQASWSITGIRIIQRETENSPLRLSHSSAPTARLIIPSGSFSSILIERLPKSARKTPGAFSVRVLTTMAVISIVSIAAVWAVLTYAPGAAARIMPEWSRDHLGNYAENAILSGRKECKVAAGRSALLKIGTRLVSRLEDPPDFSVRVFEIGIPNAFALPGGRLVVTSGLIDQAESADEVAGVLAHELGHAVHRHPETGFVRGLGLQAFLALFTGTSDTLVGAAGLLTLLSYSRSAEEEADAFAIDLMRQTKIDRKGIADFFSRLSKRNRSSIGKTLNQFSFLSTHPDTAARIENFTAGKGWPTEPVLSDREWQALKGICAA